MGGRVEWHTAQGSVLGPLLFLIFINDLEDAIMSMILKFADDTTIFRKVTRATDGVQLQQDLNRLCDWAEKCKMDWSSMLQNAKPCISAVGILNISVRSARQGKV